MRKCDKKEVLAFKKRDIFTNSASKVQQFLTKFVGSIVSKMHPTVQHLIAWFQKQSLFLPQEPRRAAESTSDFVVVAAVFFSVVDDVWLLALLLADNDVDCRIMFSL